MSTDIDKFAQLADYVVQGGGDDYEAPRETSAPAPAGLYTLVRVDNTNSGGGHQFEETATNKWRCVTCTGDLTHGKSIAKDGQPLAWFRFKTAIVGTNFDGRNVYVNNNTYVGSFKSGTGTVDYLKACNPSIQLSTLQSYEDAFHSTLTPFSAMLDWEWTCWPCKMMDPFLVGAANPRKGKKYTGAIQPIARMKDGTVDYEQPCPQCTAPVAARLYIKRYVVPTTGTAAQVIAAKTVLSPAEG